MDSTKQTDLRAAALDLADAARRYLGDTGHSRSLHNEHPLWNAIDLVETAAAGKTRIFPKER